MKWTTFATNVMIMHYFLIALFTTVLFAAQAQERQRVFVLTDMSNEPDDEQSMVRFLVYANEYDIEGLVATTSTWLRSGPREDLIRRQIHAYNLVRDNLLVHKAGFPTHEHLLSVTATGQTSYGLEAVGEDQSTAGSQLLLQAADRNDDRPLWVTVWGGANTLAQALFDARRDRSKEELDILIAKLRVYSISDQDDAGPWLRREFPGLFYIVSSSNTDWKEYWRATWTGIAGDRHYKNGAGHYFELVDNPWLEEHIINNHGPLGALYPRLAYIMEGDTPSFLGLIQNGLSWHTSPSYGGGGGRYQLYHAYGETRPIWTNNQDSRDQVTAENGATECTDMATIWRWRQHFQHDFAARMDWCMAERFEDANHNPVAIINHDSTLQVIHIRTYKENPVTLTAAGTYDPDGHSLAATWHIYKEAGTPDARGTLEVIHEGEAVFTPARDTLSGEVHLIFELQDSGTPSLFAYRRIIIHIEG